MVDIPEINVQIDADTTQAEAGFERAEDGIGDVGRAADRADGPVKRFGDEVDRAGRKSQRAAVPIQRTGGAMSRMGPGIQNASFQIADFATQVGAGTSATVALGQQLPQLLGGMGILGAAAGAAVAVLVPLGGALFRAGEDAVDAEEKMEGFSEAIKQLRSAATLAQTPLAQLREEFGDFADEIQRGAQVAAQAALSTALGGLEGATDGIRDSLGEAADQFDQLVELQTRIDRAQQQGVSENRIGFLQVDFDRIKRDLEDTAEGMGLTAAQAVQLNRALSSVGSAEGLGGVADAASAALDVIGDMRFEGEQIPPEVANIVAQLVEVQRAAAIGALATEDIGTAASNAADQATRLADELLNAAQLSDEFQARQMRAGIASGALPPQAAGDIPETDADRARERAMELVRRRARQAAALESRSGTGDGGETGGGVEDPLTAQERAVDAHLQRIDDLTKGSLAQRSSAYAGYFSNLIAMTGSNNEKVLRLQRSLAAAEALINASRAAAQVLADPELPFIAKFAAAASVAAAGMGFVNAIRSGSAPGGAGGASSAETAPQGTTDRLDINIGVSGRGDLAGSPAVIDSITTQILDNLRDRGGLQVIRG